MGNSASVQQRINQTFKNNHTQWGEIQTHLICIVRGVEVISKRCSVNITNDCLSERQIEATQIFDLVSTAAAESITEQSAAMIAFLSRNKSNTKQAIEQTIQTEVSNSCNILGSTTALIEGLRIFVEVCTASGVNVLNLGRSIDKCNLAQSSKTGKAIPGKIQECLDEKVAKDYWLTNLRTLQSLRASQSPPLPPDELSWVDKLEFKGSYQDSLSSVLQKGQLSQQIESIVKAYTPSNTTASHAVLEGDEGLDGWYVRIVRHAELIKSGKLTTDADKGDWSKLTPSST